MSVRASGIRTRDHDRTLQSSKRVFQSFGNKRTCPCISRKQGLPMKNTFKDIRWRCALVPSRRENTVTYEKLTKLVQFQFTSNLRLFTISFETHKVFHNLTIKTLSHHSRPPISGWSRDRPQPGSLSQPQREAWKRDPGNEVNLSAVYH